MYFVVNSSVLIVLSIGLIKLNECRPDGAPESACGDLLPHHGAEPQTSKSPFVLKAHPKNHSIELIIESSDGTPFRGFAIQSRPANATSGAIGKFVTNGQQSHTITCFGSPDNTITHSDRSDKNKMIIEWMPPIGHNHDIQIVFTGTVVKTAKQFWTNLSSEKISLDSHEMTDGNVIDDHSHHKDSKTGHKSDKVRNNSSDRFVNHLLIISIVLLVFYKI